MTGSQRLVLLLRVACCSLRGGWRGFISIKVAIIWTGLAKLLDNRTVSELKRTPLFDFHVQHGGRLVPFAGWEMPVQYSSILEEHRAVREAVGLFDVSHMGEALVSGKGAEAFLDYVLPGKILGQPVGKAIYSMLCNEDGGVVDDLIVYKLTETEFLLCLNASNTQKDIDWLRAHIGGFDCTLEDVSDVYAQLAIQGPLARKLLNDLAEVPEGKVFDLKKFHFKESNILGFPVIVCGTGYTGEDGCEIYCHTSHAHDLAPLILQYGEKYGIRLCGLGARDSLRLEAGLPLYGHELSDTISPLEAGLGWTLDLGKAADFVGKAALLRQKAAGAPRKVVFFTLDDKRIARAGAAVFAAGAPVGGQSTGGQSACSQPVGEVLSGTQSPMLDRPIGSALICADALKEGAALEVDIRGQRYPLNLKKPPLHKA